mgnify:FL=1
MSELQSTRSPSRGLLIRWIGWFGIANGLLFALIGSRYLLAFGVPGSTVALIYVALAFVAHFALLGFLPMLLLLGPVATVTQRKGILMALGALFAAAGLTLLVLDTNIFAQYRYHLSLSLIHI